MNGSIARVIRAPRPGTTFITRLMGYPPRQRNRYH
jgi:hypothetical protein